MKGTPSFRGSISSRTFEGEHSITNSFSITNRNNENLLNVTPTAVTCSVHFNELSPNVCNYLKNVSSDVQNQIDECLRPSSGVLHLTEDITVDGCDEKGDAYTFAGVTPNELHCLSGVHTNIQHQFDTINAVSDTAFKVVSGLIELTEDIK